MNGKTIRPGLSGLLFSDGDRGGYSPSETGRRWIYDPRFLLIVRLVLAAVFIYAATHKIGRPLQFADEIKMYGIIDLGPLLFFIAIILPWVELFCGLSLLTGLFIRGSALILLVLNLIFIVVVSYRTIGIIISEGTPLTRIYFDCGCGFGETYAWKKLIEDTIFLACSFLILLAPRHRHVLSPVWR